MTVTQDLVRAEIAIAYVRKHVPLGAANRPDDQVRQGQDKLADLYHIGMEKFASWKQGHPDATMLEQIRANAEIAKGLKTGVCGDQADIAFCYLYDNGVRNIGYIQFRDIDAHEFSHAFVVLGITQDPGREWRPLVQDTTAADSAPAIWGQDLVVCDPWNKDYYEVNPIKWRHGYRQLLRSLAWTVNKRSDYGSLGTKILEMEVLVEADIECQCLIHV